MPSEKKKSFLHDVLHGLADEIRRRQRLGLPTGGFSVPGKVIDVIFVPLDLTASMEQTEQAGNHAK